MLAGPLDAVAALARLLPTSELWGKVGFSLLRIAGGCAAGYLAAGALAAAAHRWSGARILLAPPLSAIKGTPVACVVVLLLIWFGSRNVSAIAVFLMVLPGIYFPVLAGLDELDAGSARPLREVFDIIGTAGDGCLQGTSAPRGDRAGTRPERPPLLRRVRATAARFLSLTWPAVLPYLTAASRTVLGMSWKAGVAAELIGTPDGSIGERIYQAKLLLETADLFAWTIVVVALSWAFERLVLAALKATWPAAGSLAARLAERHGTAKPHPESLDTTRKDAARSDAHEDALTSDHDKECVPYARICAQDLVAGYPSTNVRLGPLNFTLEPDGAICLWGASGSGKTTMLKTILGLIPPVSGPGLSVESRCSKGQGVSDAPRHFDGQRLSVAPRCSIVFQDSRLIDELDAVDNVLIFSARTLTRQEAIALLGEMLPESALDVPVSELSGGQRRRVEIARALAHPSFALVLDEPFNGLDADSRAAALACIARHRSHRAIALATHNAADASDLNARVIDLDTQ